MPGKVQNEELSKTKKLANVKKQNNNQKPPISKCIKNKYSLMQHVINSWDFLSQDVTEANSQQDSKKNKKEKKKDQAFV